MRGTVLTSLMLLSIALTGCLGEEDTEPSQDMPEVTNLESQEIENSIQKTQDDCEERGGTWTNEDLECSFQEEPKEEPKEVTEDSGPINIPPCSTIASEGLNQTSNPSDWPEIRNGQWLAINGLTNVSYASI